MGCGRSVLLALLAIALVVTGAEAQRGGSDGPSPSLRDLDELVPKLESKDPAEVRETVDLLSMIDHPKVIPPLAKLLRSGQPDAVTDRVLEVLGVLAHRKSIDVLVELTRHRRPGARRRAYEALSKIKDRRIPKLLEQGLRDQDRTVRGAAALALGDIGARQSLDVLFEAFEAGVVEAAIAIGKLGKAKDVERFSEHLGKRPLGIMLSGYRRFVKRDDLPDKVKSDIVNRLGEVSGRMVRRFLQDYLKTFPGNADSDLYRNVQRTLRRIPEDGAEQ